MGVSRMENSKMKDFSVPSFNGSTRRAAGAGCRRELWGLVGLRERHPSLLPP